MTDNDLLLKKTIADVMKIGVDAVDDNSSMDTIKEWDSLKHLNLVLALELAFGVSFTEEQTMEIVSLPLTRLVLSELGVKFD